MTSILLNKNNIKKFVIGRIDDFEIWNMYEKAIASFWTFDEISMNDDLKDWKDKLNDSERFFIKHILAFFANSDSIIMENIAINFYSEINNQTVKQFYAFQLAIEAIHAQTYNETINLLITDDKEKDLLFSAVEDVPVIKNKAQWAIKWFDPIKNSFAERLFAFSLVEGLFFSASFASIFWLKKRGLMRGLTFSNELISRDENLHTQFAQLLYNKYIDNHNKLTQDRVFEIIKEAVDIETEFISKALPSELLGINSTSMIQYVQFVADRLLTDTGYDKLFNSNNPFDWMTLMSLETKTNFFESRVSSYQKAKNNNNNFEINEDF